MFFITFPFDKDLHMVRILNVVRNYNSTRLTDWFPVSIFRVPCLAYADSGIQKKTMINARAKAPPIECRAILWEPYSIIAPAVVYAISKYSHAWSSTYTREVAVTDPPIGVARLIPPSTPRLKMAVRKPRS